jgi:hypothetical protein
MPPAMTIAAASLFVLMEILLFGLPQSVPWPRRIT